MPPPCAVEARVRSVCDEKGVRLTAYAVSAYFRFGNSSAFFFAFSVFFVACSEVSLRRMARVFFARRSSGRCFCAAAHARGCGGVVSLRSMR